MKRILIVLAVLAASIAAGGTAATVALPVAAAQVQLAKPPMNTEDSCLCGGQITYSFYRRYERGAFDECWYEGRAPNGTVVNYIVNTVPSSQGC